MYVYRIADVTCTFLREKGCSITYFDHYEYMLYIDIVVLNNEIFLGISISHITKMITYNHNDDCYHVCLVSCPF
jgi:hypothetical protein